jgi:hypothetical protein
MCKREGEKEKILFLGLDNLIYIAGQNRLPRATPGVCLACPAIMYLTCRRI